MAHTTMRITTPLGTIESVVLTVNNAGPLPRKRYIITLNDHSRWTMRATLQDAFKALKDLAERSREGTAYANHT